MTTTEAPPSNARIVPSRDSQHSPWLRSLDRAVRRLLDLVAASLGLLLLSPFFVLVALRLKRDSPGPVFYHGPRTGKDGRPFQILKFRTMYERAESYDGPKITAQDDDRITSIGSWLRDTKLNELPQLWNVLIGEMSLVGPRPEDPDFVRSWPEDARRELLSVRPGITSPASILYRDEERLLGADNFIEDYLQAILPTKLRLDLIYVRHRTLLTDLDVIFWTMLALLPQLKRKHISEHALYWGPLARLVTGQFSWFVVDFFVALAAVAISGFLWRSSRPLDLGPGFAAGIALLIAFLFSTVNALVGLNRVFWSKAPPTAILDLAFSTGLMSGVLELLNHTLGSPLLPDGLVVIIGLLAFLGFILVRYRSRILTGLATRWVNIRGHSQAIGERVLIIGAGEVGTFATWLIRNSDLGQAFNIVGMVDDAPRKQGARIDSLQVLGNTADIPELVNRHDIGLLVFAIASIDPGEKEQILDLCHMTSVPMVLMPDVLATLNAFFLPQTKSNVTAPDSHHLQQWLGRLDKLIQGQDWEQMQAEVTDMRRKLADVQ